MSKRLAIPAVLFAALLPATDAAARWSSPRSLNSHGKVYGVSVAFGKKDRIAAAFTRFYDGEGRVELRRGTARGLGPPVILDRSQHAIGETALAFDAYNRSVVAWTRFVGSGRHGNHRLRVTSMDSQGEVLGPYSLTYAHESAYDPEFVHGAGGRLLLHWSRRSFASFAPWEATDRSSGPGLRVRLPAGAVFGVSLVVEADGTVVAVWPDNGHIMSASRPPGRDFGAAVQISSDSGYARAPHLALARDGRAVAVWLQSTGSASAVVAAQRPAGGTFLPPSEIASAAENARSPRIAGTTVNEVLVTYVATAAQVAWGNASGTLKLVRLGVPGSRPTRPRTLSADGEKVQDASIGADESGSAIVAWVSKRGARGRVDSRRIVPGGILGDIRTLSGSDNILGGRPVSLAVRPNGAAIAGWVTEGLRARYAVRDRI